MTSDDIEKAADESYHTHSVLPEEKTLWLEAFIAGAEFAQGKLQTKLDRAVEALDRIIPWCFDSAATSDTEYRHALNVIYRKADEALAKIKEVV